MDTSDMSNVRNYQLRAHQRAPIQSVYSWKELWDWWTMGICGKD